MLELLLVATDRLLLLLRLAHLGWLELSLRGWVRSRLAVAESTLDGNGSGSMAGQRRAGRL